MEIKILITDKYLNENKRRIFDVEKVNGQSVDFYNELLYNKPTMDAEYIPIFLKQVIEGGNDYNGSGFSVGPVMEGDKVWVEKDKVEFYVLDYKIQYPLKEVIEVSLELAHKALEAADSLQLKSKGIVDDAWIKDIEESILKLGSKIKS